MELAAIGTIADQIPLVGVNRSIVKFGLEYLNQTKRPGLSELFKEAAVEKGNIGTYEVGFMVAPRLNAMGRLHHAIESLRIVCTKDKDKAKDLAIHLGKVNKDRQKIVEEVLLHAGKLAQKEEQGGIILVAHESYHEGVIGLAAARLVETYYRPAIVLSKGKNISKASARSIPGVNIIEIINKLNHLHLGGGGHKMAAGFSIDTSSIDKFKNELDKISKDLIKGDILIKSIKVDTALRIAQINMDLVDELTKFAPFGNGNPVCLFLSRKVKVIDARQVGREAKHLKLKLKGDGLTYNAIAFGMGELISRIKTGSEIDIVYTPEENIWNGSVSLQLKLKDIRIN